MRLWIAMTLLLFVLTVSSSAATGRDEPFDFRELWNSWPTSVQSIYLMGFVDGGGETFIAAYFKLDRETREAVRQKTATNYPSDSLRDVMSDLYRDPANMYIRFPAMIYIARDKLDGKDVSQRLMEARSSEREFNNIR